MPCALAPADTVLPAVAFERPKAAAHGDRLQPRHAGGAHAEDQPARAGPAPVEAVQADPRGRPVAAMEIAGPGFINLRGARR